MPKIIIQVGLDIDLFEEIESQRGTKPRSTFINENLRKRILPISKQL